MMLAVTLHLVNDVAWHMAMDGYGSYAGDNLGIAVSGVSRPDWT
jgi:hypothetical protein